MGVDIFAELPDAFVEAFGEPLTWTPKGGSATATDAILRVATQIVTTGDGASSRVRVPVLHGPESALGTMAEGDRVARGAETWRVAAPGEPDGRGMVVFRLEVVS